jgi:hypothetical protein
MDGGFEVISATTADEAINILEARSDIRRVFTDVNMPGSMDGLRPTGSLDQGADSPKESPSDRSDRMGQVASLGTPLQWEKRLNDNARRPSSVAAYEVKPNS